MCRRSTWRTLIISLLSSLLFCTSAQAERIDVSRFSSHDLNNWEEKSFVDHTHYELIKENNSTVLKAVTSAASSGMFRKIDIDLNKTPYLNWSWRVDNIYHGNNELSKEGDDYPARIYVIVSGGLFFWKTLALNYVWSSNQPVGTTWDNAYTGNAKMVVLRTGKDETSQWKTEKRNIHEDLKNFFGEDFKEINAVAIMSDSDNAKQSATAYYGDIFFTDK